MKRLIFLLAVYVLFAPAAISQNPSQTIKLLVRGDDMGSSHAANLACIESYKNGIMRSVEVMVPCAWFPEAVKMLKENPGLDVGVHLTLTSEWEQMKWRPLSCAPSLTDENGYFYPMIWKNPNFPAGSFLLESSWKLQEIEKEWRAQIELAMKLIPQVSHLSAHMGCNDMDPKVRELFNKLAKEYKLEFKAEEFNTQRFPGWGQEKDFKKRLNTFTKNIEMLKPGTYLFVDHPSLAQPEMEPIGHTGYKDVAADRDMVTRVFTHPNVKMMIQMKGIQLISYEDLK